MSAALEKMSMSERWEVAARRIAAAKAAGLPVCEHYWETVQYWDPCANSGVQLSVPKLRACGHTVCDHHILLHGMLFCPQAGMETFGFTSDAAIAMHNAKH